MWPTAASLPGTLKIAEGDEVPAFLGAARKVLDEAEALKIRPAIEGLRSLMGGVELGSAFADLDARAPGLPPDCARPPPQAAEQPERSPRCLSR
jgi:hydrogenase expression/formation protein HypC